MSRNTGFTRQLLVLTAMLVAFCSTGYAQDDAADGVNSPEIRISGADGELAANIRDHVGTPELSCSVSQRRLDRQRPQVRRNTQRAAQAIGYYQATVDITFTALSAMTAQPEEAGQASSVGNTDDNNEIRCWELDIDISPGQRVLFGDINISIADQSRAALFAPVLSTLPVQRGNPLRHSEYESLKSLISGHAIENGFFASRFTQSELAIDLQRQRADINLIFEPGERYSFGDISITTPDALSESFVQRFITLRPNSPYHSEDLVEQRQHLNSSQYFSRVAVTPDLDQTGDRVIPVNIGLTLRPRRVYTVGAGVNTDSGPRLTGNYEDRYINRRGHRFLAETSLSTLQQDASVSYVIPLQDPVNDSLRFSAGFQREEADTYITNTYRTGVTHRSLVAGSWVQNLYVNYEREKSELIETETGDPELQRNNTTIFGANWTRTKSDDPIFPRNGWRLFGQVQGSYDGLLSNTTFTQIEGNVKWIHSLGPTRIIARAEAATTIADTLLELPVSVRYFTGGDTSIRGYQFGELGAMNEEGEVIGGKHLLVGSLEYDFPVMGEDWRGAVFFDTGNSFRDFDTMTLKRSAGIGFRWISPIGPIRLDLAHAISDDAFRLHITMGPDL
ncbi:autotransporter assembly complex family protein [Pseudohongiella nitratireducens]|uniref:autotransporter assembly complex protein TamA n=1 Tax=Pseudohongiella nitratireducens TaxID=1768907 RepID=UPI0030EED71A|tara:strand:+ start:3845 stop:5701 length:1857 start_codon:yes stop_codon:yes gene_type:complete